MKRKLAFFALVAFAMTGSPAQAGQIEVVPGYECQYAGTGDPTNIMSRADSRLANISSSRQDVVCPITTVHHPFGSPSGWGSVWAYVLDWSTAQDVDCYYQCRWKSNGGLRASKWAGSGATKGYYTLKMTQDCGADGYAMLHCELPPVSGADYARFHSYVVYR